MNKRNSISNEEIEQRHEALPNDVATAFEGVDTSRRIFEIGRTHGLGIDTIGAVAREVGYVMLGIVPTSEFVSDLLEIVGGKEKAGAIAREINQKIFLPIRESLRKTYGTSWQDSLGAAAPSPAALLQPRPATPPPRPVPPPPQPRPPPPPVVQRLPPPPPQPPTALEAGIAKVLPPPAVVPAPPPALARKPEPLIIKPLPIPPPATAVPIASRAPEEKPSPLPTESTPRVVGSPPPPPVEPKMPLEKPSPFPGATAERMPRAAPPPAAPQATYERAKEETRKELEAFQAREKLHQEGKPSPYVITKEEMSKPERPERYDVDPYREPAE